MAKIGLLAPFEGLERRSGYDALAGMRAGLADAPVSQVDLLPAALDSSRGVRRAAQKLLAGGEANQVEPALLAVVGPFTPEAASAISDVMAVAPTQWILPFARTETGFAPLADPRWAVELVNALAEAARSQDAQRLALAGWTPGWPPRESGAWRRVASLPFVFLDAPHDVQPNDAVIWLGQADDAAHFLDDLRARGSTASFWLALAGDDPVFVERGQVIRPGAWGDVFWAEWMPVQYNHSERSQPSLSSTGNATYAATQTAIAHILGVSSPTDRWAVQIYRLSDTGVSSPLATNVQQE